jgi:hypothetical protein
MDQHHRMLASVLLILSTLASIPVNGSHQENNQKLSVTEEQEVREFARRLAARLEKTRDLSPYLNNPPASNLFDRAMTDDSDPIVDKDVASRVGSYQLRRFYIALWNIAYLSESYIYGRFLLQKTSVRDLLPQQQYPAHVVRFMKRNPTIKRWWKNVDSSDSEVRVTTMVEFYSVLNTYNEAAILMRAYFRRHPPESTATYEQNLTYLGSFLNEIGVDTCDSERDCAGLPLRTQTIRVNLPVIQLFLVRLDGRLQVLLVGLHND